MSCHVMSLFIQCDNCACGSCVTSFVPLYNLKVMKSGKGPVTIQMSTEAGRIYFDRGFCGEIRIFSRREGVWPWDQSDPCIAALTGRRCHHRTKAQIKGRIKEFRGWGGPNWDGGIWNMRRNGRQQCNTLDAGWSSQME